MNPNNCEACDHKAYPDGGWCYMFRNEPTDVCMRQTDLAANLEQAHRLLVKIALDDIAHTPPY